jgi:hypothetical protein
MVRSSISEPEAIDAAKREEAGMTMGRNWISFSLGHGIRVGRSVADPRLPSWRRFELRHILQAAAKERGETITIDDTNYLIDKAMAIGLLDADGNGDLSCLMTGTRDEIIANMIAADLPPQGRGLGLAGVVVAVIVVVALIWLR